MQEPQWVDGYPQIGRSAFFAYLEPLLSPEELFRVETAYNLSKYGHRGQKRDNGVRYFEHPKAVAIILIWWLRLIDWHTIALGLLHDIKEDSFIVTWDLLERLFGSEFVRDLKLLTKEPKDGYIDRLKMFGSWRVLAVKLADRVHNLITLGCCSAEKRGKQIRETREAYLPLADALFERLPNEDRWRARALKERMQEWCERHEAP